MYLIYLLLWPLLFAKIGSKRVMGGFNSFWWVVLSPVVGVFFVLASRRLDDERKDRELIDGKHEYAVLSAFARFCHLNQPAG